MGTITTSFALSNEEIIKHYQNALDEKMPNFSSTIKLEISERKPFLDGFEKVVLKADISGQTKKDVVFAKGDYLFNDITNAKTGESFKKSFLEEINKEDKKIFDRQLISQLKKEKHILSLGRQNKEEIYIFTDPECPYCQKHLEGMENLIKNKKVHLVFISVHGDEAFAKGVSILKESKLVKTDQEKLKIVRRYYNENVEPVGVSTEEIDEAKKIFDKYSKLGLNYVPYVVEVK